MGVMKQSIKVLSIFKFGTIICDQESKGKIYKRDTNNEVPTPVSNAIFFLNSSSAEQWCQNTLNASQESQLFCFLTWVSIYLVI